MARATHHNTSIMAIINATQIGIYLAGTRVAQATEASIEMAADAIDVTSKDSGAWRDTIPGTKQGTMSGTFLFDDEAGSPNFDSLYGGISGRVTATVRFSTGISGTKRFQGTCYVSNMSKAAGTEDAASYNVTLEFVGVITQFIIP